MKDNDFRDQGSGIRDQGKGYRELGVGRRTLGRFNTEKSEMTGAKRGVIMKAYKVLISGLIILTLGCASSPEVGSDYDPVVKFSELRTFGWQPPAADGRVNDMVENRVKAAVVDQLSGRGYEEASAAPDFLVTYRAQVTSSSSSNVSMGMSFGRSRSSGGSRSRGSSISVSTNTANVNQMREGTLVLNFLDGKTNNLIWQGSTTGAVEENLSQEERDRRISAAVSRILQEFPPEENR
jgi:hypothetical protein